LGITVTSKSIKALLILPGEGSVTKVQTQLSEDATPMDKIGTTARLSSAYGDYKYRRGSEQTAYAHITERVDANIRLVRPQILRRVFHGLR